MLRHGLQGLAEDLGEALLEALGVLAGDAVPAAEKARAGEGGAKANGRGVKTSRRTKKKEREETKNLDKVQPETVVHRIDKAAPVLDCSWLSQKRALVVVHLSTQVVAVFLSSLLHTLIYRHHTEQKIRHGRAKDVGTYGAHIYSKKKETKNRTSSGIFMYSRYAPAVPQKGKYACSASLAKRAPTKRKEAV